MYLVVGLGNPGARYVLTRHNIGFMLIDALAGGQNFKSEHRAQTLKWQHQSTQILLAKPQTFMNLSGTSVQALAQYYKIDPEHILIVHDEIDIAFGNFRYKKGGGAAGHNGIKSVYQVFPKVARLRVGVGPRIEKEGQLQSQALREQVGDVSQYVLHNFSKPEQNQLPDLLEALMQSLKLFLEQGLPAAANKYNALDVCATTG